MIVVSDNSPLNILIRIEQVGVLPALFHQVTVPSRIFHEMAHPAAPEMVRRFVSSPPSWLVVRDPHDILDIPGIDLGESAAISLAVELKADLLLVDERDARAAASSRGLEIIGAIGVIELASDRGLITELAAVHDRIRQTDFHISDEILKLSLQSHLKRRQRRPDRG